MLKTCEKECKHHGLTTHVIASENRFRCKKCRVEAVTKNRQKRKKKLVEHFGGKCIRCGYSKCIEALEFHHRDPQDKSFGVAHKGICRSWERMLAEAKKCELVCANCHRELEHQK